MTYFKRFFFFALVNFLILATIQALLIAAQSYFGFNLGPYYGPIIVIYTVLGMGGAFVSLFLSKYLVKRSMGVEIISPDTSHPTEKWLVESIYKFARQARLKKMPEVGIYPSQDVNAFATGPSKSNSLVAVSSGLLEAMDKDEAEGVLGHEVAHIANGDMVTMTLIQGVINSIVMIVSRIIADVIASRISGRRGGNFFLRFAIYMAVSMVLALLGSIIVNWFSRHREFRADLGGAKYAGRDKMIKALQKLSQIHIPVSPQKGEPETIAAFKISGGNKKKSAWVRLFMTHPPLEERIRFLKSRSI